jgi:hypothetical protein
VSETERTGERGSVQTDEDGSRWIVLIPPTVRGGRPSRVREGSLAASVIFEATPEKPLALKTPSFDFS